MQTKILVLVFLLTISSITQAQTQYYVSPNGSGSSYTSVSPGSLTGARDAIRQVNSNMTENIEVILQDGTYDLGATFELTSADAGTNGYKIIYKAENPRAAVINGATELTGWQQVDGLWEMSIPSGMGFRQIYVNGDRAIRARQPNVGERYQIISWDDANKTIKINASEIASWNNLNNVEMLVHKHWNMDHLRISSFSFIGNQAIVIPMQPERDTEFHYPFPKKRNGQSYYFENAKEFIDQPGEWYHSPSLNILYYMPRVGETLSSELLVPVLENIFSLDGANNIEIRDLVIQHSNWTKPSEIGYVGGQGGYHKDKINGVFTNYIPKTGAIRVINCDNFSFTGNLVQKNGAIGLDLVSGNNNTNVTGNVFNQIAGNGIMVMSDSKASTACVNDVIKNNYFIRCADIYSGSVPLIMTYATNTTIEHNEVVQAPYSGISVGWGWTDNTTTLQNTKVNYNYVHDFCYVMEDGGGIYTLSKQPNSEINENLVEDAVSSNFAEKISPIAGIYLDQATQSFSVTNNVLRDIENQNTNSITNNIYQSADKVVGFNTISGTTTSNPTVEANAGIQATYQSITSWVDAPNTPGRGTIVQKQNIALNKATTASGEYNASYSSEKGNDSDYSSIWGSGSVPSGTYAWWQVDLLDEYMINELGVAARQDLDQDINRKNFEIRASNASDFSSYTVLAVKDSNPFPHQGKWVVGISSTESYRFLRVVKTDGTSFNFSEFSATGELISSTTNIALNKPVVVTGEYNSNTSGEKGNDDNTSTIWASGTPASGSSAKWMVDLLGKYNITQIIMVARQDLDQAFARSDFEVQTSNSQDFNTYEVLGMQGSTAFAHQGSWSVSVQSSTAYRYVRVVKTNTDPFNFAELEVYGSLYAGDNIFLLKPSSASGEGGASVASENGNDGNNSTIWGSGTMTDAWWQVDLQGQYVINKIELIARQDLDQTAARENFEVRGSTVSDFLTYTVLASLTEPAFPHQGTWSGEVTDIGSYSYIRIAKTQGNFFNFAEIKGYGVMMNDENIALNKSTSVSGQYGPSVPGSNGNDNSTSTIWASGQPAAGTKAWWQVDLVDQYEIDRVELVARQDLDQEFARKNFRILASNSADFSTSTELASQGATPFAHQGTWVADVTEGAGFQYLRVEKIDLDVPMNMAEFRAFGKILLLKNATILGTGNSKMIPNISNTVLLYPNPVKNRLTIKSENPVKMIKVFNICGQNVLIKQTNSSMVSMYTDKLESGQFILQLTTDTGINVLSFIKE